MCAGRLATPGSPAVVETRLAEHEIEPLPAGSSGRPEVWIHTIYAAERPAAHAAVKGRLNCSLGATPVAACPPAAPAVPAAKNDAVRLIQNGGPTSNRIE